MPHLQTRNYGKWRRYTCIDVHLFLLFLLLLLLLLLLLFLVLIFFVDAHHQASDPNACQEISGGMVLQLFKDPSTAQYESVHLINAGSGFSEPLVHSTTPPVFVTVK